MNYGHSEEAAKSLRDEVIALGVKAEIFRADVSVQEEAAKMFADVKSSFGENVSVLVNNAGITRDTLLMRMKAEDWLAVINTNLNAAFYCTQLAVKDMAKARYGRIMGMRDNVTIRPQKLV